MSPNIALVGCGAIAQRFYLPTLAKHRSKFGRIWLIDPSKRARSAAASILGGDEADQLPDIDDRLDLAIVAAPNGLHYPLAQHALSQGANVLIEKPFVISPEEGRSLAHTAAERARVIAVNQTRRFYPIAESIRHRIQTGEFGALKGIVHREGSRLLWPFESGSGFARNARRTGVIMDFGVHVIDFYHYLLKPEWKFVSTVHDGFSGPEGLAQIELTANDAPVSIRLSRYHDQENAVHVWFERAEVTFGVYDSEAYTVKWNSGRQTRVSSGGKGEGQINRIADRVLINFLAASTGREEAVCDASSSMPVIELLDEIYSHANIYPTEVGAV